MRSMKSLRFKDCIEDRWFPLDLFQAENINQLRARKPRARSKIRELPGHSLSLQTSRLLLFKEWETSFS